MTHSLLLTTMLTVGCSNALPGLSGDAGPMVCQDNSQCSGTGALPCDFVTSAQTSTGSDRVGQ
jgi:hypothetical protein